MLILIIQLKCKNRVPRAPNLTRKMKANVRNWKFNVVKVLKAQLQVVLDLPSRT